MIASFNVFNWAILASVPVVYMVLQGNQKLWTAFIGAILTYLGREIFLYGFQNAFFEPEPTTIEQLFQFIRAGDFDQLAAKAKLMPPNYLNKIRDRSGQSALMVAINGDQRKIVKFARDCSPFQ